MSKLIAYHQAYVTSVSAAYVWLVFDDEAELELTRREFNKLFGRANRQRGRIVEIWIRRRRSGKAVVWGRPYVRKWTQADIAAAEERARKLLEAFGTAFD